MNNNEIKLVGIGRAGIQIVEQISANKLKNTDLIVCDIDEKNLSATTIKSQIQIKVGKPRALTTKSQFEIEPDTIENAQLDIAVNSTIDSFEYIHSVFQENSKMAVLVSDLGATTGTAVTPIIAQIAKKRGLFVVAVIFVPLSVMGETARRFSTFGVRKLRNDCDIVLVIHHDKLQKLYGTISLNNYARKSDAVIIRLIKIIHNPKVTNSHLSKIKLLFQDHKNYLSLFIGIAEGSGKWRARQAVEGAFTNSLYYKNDIQDTTNVYVDIQYGSLEITAKEKEQIQNSIFQNAGTDVSIEISMNQDAILQDSISIMIVAN